MHRSTIKWSICISLVQWQVSLVQWGSGSPVFTCRLIQHRNFKARDYSGHVCASCRIKFYLSLLLFKNHISNYYSSLLHESIPYNHYNHIKVWFHNQIPPVAMSSSSDSSGDSSGLSSSTSDDEKDLGFVTFIVFWASHNWVAGPRANTPKFAWVLRSGRHFSPKLRQPSSKRGFNYLFCVTPLRIFIVWDATQLRPSSMVWCMAFLQSIPLRLRLHPRCTHIPHFFHFMHLFGRIPVNVRQRSWCPILWPQNALRCSKVSTWTETYEAKLNQWYFKWPWLTRMLWYLFTIWLSKGCFGNPPQKAQVPGEEHTVQTVSCLMGEDVTE